MNHESALGEALKVITRKKRHKAMIRVCECGTPMIWTFFFPYCERYCLNCGTSGGMLGTGSDVEATRELIFKKRLVDAIWKQLYTNKGLMPRGQFGRSGCKKCKVVAYSHREHLSKSEKEWDEIARPYLKTFKGIFDKHTAPTQRTDESV